jgi:AraC-like DNA-binding protein
LAIGISVFTEGLGHYKNKKIDCEIEAGSVAFFLPNDPGVLYANNQKPYSQYYCRFNGSMAFEIVDRIINSWGGQISKSDKFPEVVLILKKMKQEFRKDLRSEMIVQDGLLLQILLLLLDKKAVIEKNDRYNNMIQYLESRIDQVIDIENMAKTFHLSIGHLNRLFKMNSKMSIGQYHELTKINLSKTLLENTKLPINEIASRVGYQDALYFSRVFKKSTKASPLAWRNKKK